MMLIRLNGVAAEVAPGESYADVARRMGLPALGIRVGGCTIPLGAQPGADADATALLYQDEEGRRIYERSLRFVFLMAAREVLPGVRIRLENSTSAGVYAHAPGARLAPETVERIEARMRELVRDDLPFEKRAVSREEAVRYFEEDGQEDKVRLLKYRPFEHFNLYDCGGMREYFYGEMAPSTGYVGVFALKFRLPGIEIILPDPCDPRRPATPREDNMLMGTLAESARWAEILRCENVADLNEMVVDRKLREFIRVNEALQEKSIEGIADKFAASGARLILIAGPSSSGKTTFAHRLTIALRVLGLRPVKVSMDDYYLDRDAIPREENGELDLEKLETLDVALFNEHLVRLLQGEEIAAPTFDFVAGRRADARHAIRVEAGQPIVVEGIHALNEKLTALVPRDKKFLIYISALTTLNLDDHNRIRTTDMRLLRRLVRDHNFRGTPAEGTLAMWPSVQRGERNYIFPYQERADVMFNSTLVYEAVVLKRYAYPMLARIREDSPYYTRARRLVKFLNYIRAADMEDEIPVNSILREFIGGCCFYREED